MIVIEWFYDPIGRVFCKIIQGMLVKGVNDDSSKWYNVKPKEAIDVGFFFKYLGAEKIGGNYKPEAGKKKLK